MATIAQPLNAASAPRWLFTAAIFTGSFLLFLVQPMLARMALPRLGGAPAVWNSAMLVYQGLLLAGYAYAHWLGRFGSRTQVAVHLGVLLLAALTLPLSLAAGSPPATAEPFLWVPWLLLVSVGPLFFAISAQAPLLQRWLSIGGDDPYPLYVASNLGSFCGLLAYPLLLEPLVGVAENSLWWSWGYGVMLLLVAACGLPLLRSDAPPADRAVIARVPWRTFLRWALIAAVPSGLMLSTTLHLTTDVAAMPLLWVIPLGLYLLSFTVAFAVRRTAANICAAAAPFFLLLAAAMLFVVTGNLLPIVALIAILAMFLVATALHSRLYDERPEPAQLTLFYLAMSVGGVLGGLFCALIAPLIFDWTYEHPLLLLAAAFLLGGRQPLAGIWSLVASKRAGHMLWLMLGLQFAGAIAGSAWEERTLLALVAAASAGLASLALGRRWLFTAALATSMLASGGLDRLHDTMVPGQLTRSYFGVYRVLDGWGTRGLVHGTTTHGVQLVGSPERERTPTSYYWSGSGVGRVMTNLPALLGPQARVGVVGVGLGTLGCYSRPGERWTLFEIDPTVIEIARSPSFKFLSRCLPDAPVVIGDARLKLAEAAPASFDILVIDAFSSDAIPMHLLTREAFAIYRRALRPGGLLMIHISNRHLELRPVIRTGGESVGMKGVLASAVGDPLVRGYDSTWTALSSDAALIERVKATEADLWVGLPFGPRVHWTDDHASILPVLVRPW
ncbi:spermidine synthase [Sphingomonas sp. LHG3406-1]|uniref:spermidine synthase n=1 Tax=Sphingomonas sp. LHG3406-1 TaxID=2804617 RepID=UPI002632A81A|nr:fused MFS/spermidine synthase [Sphingomonas sp. LHG3406-1]